MQPPSIRQTQIDQEIQPQIKRTYTIREYLDFDDILFHFRNMHPDLIAEYGFRFFTSLMIVHFNFRSTSSSLCTPERALELLHYMLDPVPEDADEQTKYRYPFLACEILSDEITQSKNILMNEPCLSLLFSTLERPEPIPAPQAPYICRVFHELLCHHSDEVLFLNIVS